jgi:hypothetical protein
MLLIDPINSVTSLQFYRKAARHGLVRSLLYLFYLSVIVALVSGYVVWRRTLPLLRDEFSWLGKALPTLTLDKGRLSGDIKAPIVLVEPHHFFSVVVDPSRVKPVTAEDLESKHAQVYVSQDSLTILKQPGVVQSFDLGQMRRDAPLRIDARFWNTAGKAAARMTLLLILLVFPVVFFLWKLLTTAFYSVMALALNSMLEARLSYRELFNVALYAQTFFIALRLLFLFFPRPMPQPLFIALVSTSAYIGLAIRTISTPVTPA